jgi:amino acid transporter
VIFHALGPTIYRFVTAFILLAQFAAGLSSQTVLIRILYSFSRDDNISLSKVWKYVSPKYDTPIYSIFLASGATLLLCFFAAFLPAITSISTLGIYFSYAIVLGAGLLNRDKIIKNRGPFNLGKYSYIIHTISFFWALFVTGIMIIPPIGNSGKTFVVFLIVLLIYYMFIMRKSIDTKFE